jgi:hypothetical protein
MSKIIQKKVIVWFIAIIMSIFVSGCGGGEDPILGQGANIAASGAVIVPEVVAVTPVNNDISVSYTIKNIIAEFSIPMDLTTLTTTSFTLVDNNNISAPVSGVTYANKVVNLALSADLLVNTVYTATINTNAKSTDGVALLNNYVWTFTTGVIPDTILPEVTSTSPINNATNVPITKLITATFSEAMIPSSITATTPATFSVKETINPLVNIAGVATYSVINQIAAFNPTLDLAANTSYTATITTVAKDLSNNQMIIDYSWTFITAATPVIPPVLVSLGLSSTYGIASTAGITNTPTMPRTQIDGDVVLNPTAICDGVTVDGLGGIGLCGGLNTVPLINGTVVSKTPPYPDTTTAQNITDDLRAAYLSITPANMPGGTSIAAGTTLGATTGNALVVGDNLFYTGVYTSSTSILITGDLTLDAQGDANATFVFQSASTVGTAPDARILLVNGAKASNVYWQAGSAATLQTNTIWNGNILAYGDITMVNGASSCGRLFAGAFTAGAFVLDSNRVSVPGDPSAPIGCE